MRAVYLLLYWPWRSHRVCPDRPHGRCAQNSSVPVRNLTCSFLAFVMLSVIIHRASKPQVATNHEIVYAISLPVDKLLFIIILIYNNILYTTLARNLNVWKLSCQKFLSATFISEDYLNANARLGRTWVFRGQKGRRDENDRVEGPIPTVPVSRPTGKRDGDKPY